MTEGDQQPEQITWSETRARNGAVELHVEFAGDPTALGSGAPPILLVAGSDATGLRWPAELVGPLLAAGAFVVRFDHRDTGLSTVVDPDTPYRLDAMVLDVLAVADALDLASFHVVGYSMGGAIAQLLALDHADRVASLTLVSTTPGLGDERLPGPADQFADAVSRRWFEGPPRRTARDACITWTVDLYRLLAGPRFGFDEDRQRALAEAEFDRAWTPETGHGIAVTASPSRLDRLGEIVAVTTIVHGTSDPVFPLEHGHELAARIPDARLEIIEHLGHEVPAEFGPDLAAIVLATAARAG
jgi:pimeloyl-ACP methyl ester carboxylesterase